MEPIRTIKDETVGLPKIIFVLMIVFAGWYLYRKFVQDATRLARASEVKRKEQATGAVGTLVRDPVTGEYRVKHPDEG